MFSIPSWYVLATPTVTGPTKNPLAEVAQEVASERYVAFAVR
jgi:hypothetical protein